MIQASRKVVAIPPRSWAFVVAASLGVAFLLVIAVIGLLAFAFHGDCFASEAECLDAAQAQAAQSPVFFAVVGLLVVLATFAVAAGGRRLPGVLLVVVVAGLVLNQLADAVPTSFSWMPRQVSLLSPGMALLAFASSAQLLEQAIRARLTRASA
jgi:hypothetical protein